MVLLYCQECAETEQVYLCRCSPANAVIHRMVSECDNKRFLCLKSFEDKQQ